jgi:hypothetical protein
LDSFVAPLSIQSDSKLLDEVRRRVLAGEEPARLAADIRALTRQALALLEHGPGDYGAGSTPRR